MDGRWKRWACGGLVALSVGCNRNAVNPPTAGLPTPDGKPSLLQSAFRGNPKFGPPPAEPVVAREKRPKGEGLRPDTEVALADVEVEAAFDPSRPAGEKDQLLDSARQKYQKALDKSPGHQAALLGLARMYAKSGDRDRMAAMYQAAIQARPTDHALIYQMATAQARLGDWQGAAGACVQALAIDPENRTYRKTLGYCQARLGQPDMALDTLRGVMPEAEARYFLGRTLVDDQKPDEGRQHIELALRANPEFDPARVALAELKPAAAAAPPVPTPTPGLVQVGYEQPAGER